MKKHEKNSASQSLEEELIGKKKLAFLGKSTCVVAKRKINCTFFQTYCSKPQKPTT